MSRACADRVARVVVDVQTSDDRRRRVIGAGVSIFGGYALWHGVTPFETTNNAYIKGDLILSTKVLGFVTEVLTENNQRVAARAGDRSHRYARLRSCQARCRRQASLSSAPP